MHSLTNTKLSTRALPGSPLLPARKQTALAWPPRNSSCTSSSSHQMYEHALELSRLEAYDRARESFEDLLECHPHMCKAWVSYAQMERRLGRTHDASRLHVARQILQRGLQLNPDSGCLAQAWGLMELQKGNFWAAVRLLERSVMMDPVLEPVLKWKPVSTARMTVAGSSSRRLARARVACASAGGTPAAACGNSAAAAGTAAVGGSSSGSMGSTCGSSSSSSCMSSM